MIINATHPDSQGRAAFVLAKFGVKLTLAKSANPARRWWQTLAIKKLDNLYIFMYIYVHKAKGVADENNNIH